MRMSLLRILVQFSMLAAVWLTAARSGPSRVTSAPLTVILTPGMMRATRGERSPRVARIIPGVKITVKGADVTLEGPDLAAVSQTAANIENCTKIRNKDIRIFQDGVYITKKGA